MDTYSIILKVIMALGGLGLFLIGMKNMGEGLELAAGNKLRTLLEKITSNKYLGMLVGLVVTAVIQSSSATAAMVVGFAGGALVGWLCTAGTRAAMANWGLPATFAVPAATIVEGAFGAVVFALLVAIPSALAIVRRRS